MTPAIAALLARYGVEVRYEDLGAWGDARLYSEYDPQGPIIRVNSRILTRLPEDERERFAARAVAHELYHHREHCGEIVRIPARAQREAAADHFARRLL